MGRQRSAAVRYPSKAAADSDKLLVKANRTLHVDVCCSGNSNTNNKNGNFLPRNIATAVGIQGWRKAMEDAHIVWLKDKQQQQNNNSNNRFYRSFTSGPINCEHGGNSSRFNAGTASNTATAMHSEETGNTQNNNNNNNNTSTSGAGSGMSNSINPPVTDRDSSPAPALISVTDTSNINTNTTNSATNSISTPPPLMSSPSASMNPHNIDLLGDPANLPNSGSGSSTHPYAHSMTSFDDPSSPVPSLNSSPMRKQGTTITAAAAHADASNSSSEHLGKELDELSNGTSIEGFIAVFDGHGGDSASKYCCAHLGKLLFQEVKQLENSKNNNTSNNTDVITDADFQKAFNKAFLACDDQLRNHFASIQNAEAIAAAEQQQQQSSTTTDTDSSNVASPYLASYASPLISSGNTTNSGSTAAGALILKRQIILFSVGDCRSGVFRCCSKNNSGGKDSKINNNNSEENTNDDDDDGFELLGKLDDDHRPGGSAKETERLNKIGASVINGRVDGKLGVSRAFGDFNFKRLDGENASNEDPLLQFSVVCVPEINVIQTGELLVANTTDDDDDASNNSSSTPILITVGCDGVFETQDLAKLPKVVMAEIKNEDEDYNYDNDDDNHKKASSSSEKKCSSVFGTVRVAQRSISKNHPISEQGGLLPGSDNVTFMTVLLNSNNNRSTSSNREPLLSPRDKVKQCC